MQARKPSDAARAPFIYRKVSFEREAFDALKEFQRKEQRREGRPMTNGEALSRLILAATRQ